MTGLARVYLFKIIVTAAAWCTPLFLYTEQIALALESSTEATHLLLRLLGCAYAALCVGYAFAMLAALRGERRPGTLWAGVVSNGGACFLIGWTIVTGAWEPWSTYVRWLLLASAVLTAAITGGLLWYGLLFDRMFGGRARSPAEAAAGNDAEPGSVPAAAADDATSVSGTAVDAAVNAPVARDESAEGGQESAAVAEAEAAPEPPRQRGLLGRLRGRGAGKGTSQDIGDTGGTSATGDS